jgi:hypothetical protein
VAWARVRYSQTNTGTSLIRLTYDLFFSFDLKKNPGTWDIFFHEPRTKTSRITNTGLETIFPGH